jgi:hypothetical protein
LNKFHLLKPRKGKTRGGWSMRDMGGDRRGGKGIEGRGKEGRGKREERAIMFAMNSKSVN